MKRKEQYKPGDFVKFVGRKGSERDDLIYNRELAGATAKILATGVSYPDQITFVYKTVYRVGEKDSLNKDWFALCCETCLSEECVTL